MYTIRVSYEIRGNRPAAIIDATADEAEHERGWDSDILRNPDGGYPLAWLVLHADEWGELQTAVDAVLSAAWQEIGRRRALEAAKPAARTYTIA